MKLILHLAVIVLMCMISLILFVKSPKPVNVKTLTVSRRSKYWKRTIDDNPPSFSGAILLQLSPVDQKNQIHRLRSIENAWAIRANLSGFSLFASTPYDEVQTKDLIQFRLIRLPNQQLPKMAFANMFESLFLVLSETFDSWIIMANDHTFLIPENLKMLLTKLDPHVAYYGGNRLQRGLYKDFPLYFASGGAGAIFSRPAAVMYFLSLAIVKNKFLVDKLHTLNNTGYFRSYCTGFHPDEGEGCGCAGYCSKRFVCLMGYVYEWVVAVTSERQSTDSSKVIRGSLTD